MNDYYEVPKWLYWLLISFVVLDGVISIIRLLTNT